MEHSKNFVMVKDHYDDGDWSIDRVWKVVGKSTGITESEYQEITGLVYPDKVKVEPVNK